MVDSVIAASVKRPGAFLQVTLGVGPVSPGDAPRKVLLYGNKTSAGTATVEQSYAVTSESLAKELFGAGSELHLMVKYALLSWPGVTLYAIAITESAGTAASGTLTYTGTTTAAGAHKVTVLGETITVAIASGDDPTAQALAVSNAINDQTDWPVTASPAAGVVTVTARHKGPRGNSISLRAESEVAGGSVAVSAAYLAGGATSDDPQDALDAVAPERYHYHVAPYQDATNLAKFKTHVDTYAGPDHGMRQLVVWASIDTLANTTTVATGLNHARGNTPWLFNADDTPAQIAAAIAARRALREGQSFSYNLDGEGINPGDVPLPIKVPFAKADWPETSEIESALNNGITPLGIANGSVFITRSVTNRSQDSSGNPNYAVIDTHQVVVPDALADDLNANWPVFQQDNPKAADDEDFEGEPPDPGVATPSKVADWIYERALVFEAANDIPSAAQLIAGTAVARVGGRFNASIPVEVIALTHQFSGDIRQVG